MKRVLDVYFAWAQNATFFKKLRFGLSQTHFIVNYFIYARFGLQKVQTNAHFIEFCCQESGSESEFRIMITKVLKYTHIMDFIEQKKIDIIQMCYVTVPPLTRNLWQFIFGELLEKSRYVYDPEEAKRISSARGEWVLED